MKKNRLVAMLLAVIMTFALTGCTSEIMGFDFMFIMYGWDGIVNGEEIWVNEARKAAAEQKTAEETEDIQSEDVSSESDETDDVDSEETETEVVTEVVTEKNEKGEVVTKVVEKTVTKQSTDTTKSNGGSTNTTTKSSGSSGGSNSSGGGSSSATDAISVFNNAVNAGKPTKCTYAVSGATMTTDSGTVNKLFDASVASGQNGSGKSGNASCFTTISSSDVSSSSIKDNGSTYTVTIKLKTAKVAVTAKPAQKGYEYFMDAATCGNLVRTVNSKMYMLSNGYINLSNGSITATVNKSTGKFTSCKLTLTEVYYDGIEIASLLEGNETIAKLLGITELYGTFTYNLTVDYTF